MFQCIAYYAVENSREQTADSQCLSNIAIDIIARITSKSDVSAKIEMYTSLFGVDL